MANREDKYHLTPEQFTKVVSAILKTEPFKRAKQMRELFVFLSKNAVDQAIPLKDIHELRCFAHLNLNDRREKKRDDAEAGKVAIFRLRKALDEFYTRFHYDYPVRLALPDAVGGSYRLAVCKNDSVYAGSEPVNQFWLPFLKPGEPAQIFIDPLNRFADCQPKRVESWRDRGPKDTYFPLGLLQGISVFSDFLRSRNIGWQFDYEERVQTPDTCAIIIGNSLFRDLQPTGIKLPTLLNEQKGMWIDKTQSSQDSKARLADAKAEGSEDFDDFVAHDEDTIEGVRLVEIGRPADHFREKNGARFFRCFACATRVPISWQHGVVAWRLSANHSIAVEAVLKFLVTKSRVEELWARMRVPSRVHSGDDALEFHRPELAPTLEELSLIFQVTCSLTDAESLNLRPGIPRNFLHIDETKLLTLIQPQLPKLSSLFYDRAATSDDQWDLLQREKRNG